MSDGLITAWGESEEGMDGLANWGIVRKRSGGGEGEGINCSNSDKCLRRGNVIDSLHTMQ